MIGAVAYGGYQLGKLSAGYGNYGWGRQHGYGFNQWNRDREADGMLCRNTNDCNWIDPRLDSKPPFDIFLIASKRPQNHLLIKKTCNIFD